MKPGHLFLSPEIKSAQHLSFEYFLVIDFKVI